MTIDADTYDVLIDQLKRDEGFVGTAYKCPAGYITLGYGHNCETNPISEECAEHILVEDVGKIAAQLERNEVYLNLSDARKAVLINMGINLGIRGLMGFRRMWAALADENYDLAADEMLLSRWHEQVGVRSDRLALAMITGELLDDY